MTVSSSIGICDVDPTGEQPHRWRDKVDRSHALTSIAVLGGAVLFAFAWPGKATSMTAWGGAALLIGGALIGVPHGSSDFVVAHRALKSTLARAWLPVFLVGYLAIVAAVLFGWFVAPLPTLLVFIILSGAHFGHGDLDADERRPKLALAVRATTPLLPVLLLHPAGVTDIIALLGGVEKAAVARALDVVRWPLGCVDEFDQAQACGEGDDRSIVCCRLLASEGNTLEALQPSDSLLDAGAGFIKGAGEEGRLVLFVGLTRDHGRDAALPCRISVGFAGIAFVADDGARLKIRADVEQGSEVTPIGGLTPGQVKGDDVARGVRFGMDFCGKATTGAPKRLSVLPPFAPAADTWARTMVESNIWTRRAVSLIDASVSKKASNTPALLSRSKRFHTLFQGPKRSGKARQRTFSTLKKWSASRKSRSSAALRPRRGRQARNTASVCVQSCSVIRVDIDLASRDTGSRKNQTG